jgi:hypothetical protein
MIQGGGKRRVAGMGIVVVGIYCSRLKTDFTNVTALSINSID